MRNFTRLLVLFLGLTTATSVFYAYQQHRALRGAREAAAALDRERADLREQLRRHSRGDRVIDPSGTEPATAEASATAAARAEAIAALPAPGAETPTENGPGRLPAFLENPEAQRLMGIQQRAALDQRYGDLFRLLNLPPAQLERFKDLLVERQTAAMDVLAAARSQGLNNRENRGEIRSLLEATQAEIDANIRALVGDTNFQRYQNYNQTQPQRAVVNRLAERLSYSSLPLSSQQSEQLVQMLAANSPGGSGPAIAPAVNFRTGAGAGAAVFLGAGGAPISDEFVTQAATVLNPTQLEALRQVQAEQKAQADLGQLMRETRGRRTTPANPTPAATTPPRG